MGNWTGSGITEASGLAYSRSFASIGYVHNDENGPLYVVNFTTGATVGTISIKDRTLVDPEDIDIDVLGRLWWADIGDNDAVRSGVAVYMIGEPGPGTHGAKPWVRYPLRYPSGTPHNAETFICWPNGKKQIVSKVANGAVYELPSDADLQPGVTNQLVVAHGSDPDLDFASGGVASKDGKWAFVVRRDHNSSIRVFTSAWEFVDDIPMPAMTKPEGICMQPDGKKLIVCDDKGGTGGKYQTVTIPEDWQPAVEPPPWVPPPETAPPPNPCAAAA